MDVSLTTPKIRQYIILGFFCLLYVVYSVLTLQELIPIPKLGNNYQVTDYTVFKNSLTPGKSAIKSLLHILILFKSFFLLKSISKKWGWDILPLQKWPIRKIITIFVIVLVSQIIITIAEFIITGRSLWPLINLLREVSETLLDYDQYYYLFYFFAMGLAKILIPGMILTSLILIPKIIFDEKEVLLKMVESEKRENQQLQKQVEEKANIIIIQWNKTKFSPIDLNNISLFTTGNSCVQVYDKQLNEVLEATEDSLTKIEKKIENSGWSEDKFLRVSDSLLIKPSSIRVWVTDSGEDVIYLKYYRKYGETILGQKVVNGIKVSNSKKYGENQQIMRDMFQSKKI